MTQLSANANREYEESGDPLITDVPVDASATIYEGAAVGENSSAGTARQLEDNDSFLGFAERKADNSSGSAGDVDCRVRQRGRVVLTVAGANNINTKDAAVYAQDSNTFSLTDSGSDTQIGKLERVVDTTNTKAVVYFEATALRSI